MKRLRERVFVLMGALKLRLMLRMILRMMMRRIVSWVFFSLEEC